MEDEASSALSPPSSTDASSSPVFSRGTHAAPAAAPPSSAASVSAVLCDEEIAGWAEVRAVAGGCVDCAVNLSLRRSSGKAVHELLERAARSGLRELLLIGGTLAGSAACLKLAEAPEFRRHGVLLYAAVGVHPLEAHSWTATTQAELTLLLSHPLCVAVGETGLNYHAKPYSRPPARGLQRWVFARHIELARRSGKPLFLHERGAGAAEGVLAELDAEQFPWSACVLHCFSNGGHVLERILARGMRVAVSGHAATRRHDAGVTLRHALQRHAARSPAHRAALLGQMMVETDSPHLVPDAVHGALRAKRRSAAGEEEGGDGAAAEDAHGKPSKPCNEPAYLPAVLRAVADLVDATPAEVAESTAAVAREFFGFRSADDAHARDYLMTQASAVATVSGEVKEGGSSGAPPPAAPPSSSSSSSGDGASAATLAPRRPPAVCPAWSQPVHEMCVLEVSRENAERRQRLRAEWTAEEAAAAAAAAGGRQEEAEAASPPPAASGGDAAHCFFDADRAAFVRRWRRGKQGGRVSPEPAAASQATVFTNIASLGRRVVECTRAVAAAAGEELVEDAAAGGEERVELAVDLDLSLGTGHRFLVPQELSKLCKQMRGVGLDTVLAESTRLPQMAQQAEAEGRLLVMRHAKNLDQHVHGALREVKWVRLSCEAAAQQMRQILTLFGISPEKSDLQKRCCVCNAKEWIRERGEDVKDEVEETVWREHPKLWRCGGCRKLFWNGGIYKKAKAHFTAMYLNGGGTGGRGGSQPRSGTSTPSASTLDVEGTAASSPSASPPTDATPPPPTPTLSSPPPKEAGEGEEEAAPAAAPAPAAAAAAAEVAAATAPQVVEGEDGASTAASTTTAATTSAPRRGKGSQRKARRAKRIAADAAAASEGAAPKVHPQRPRPVSTKEITPANVSKLLGKKELHVVLVHAQHGVALFQGTDAVAAAAESASVSAPVKPAAAAAAVAAKPAATGGGGGGGRAVWGLPYTRVLPTPLAVRDFAEELRAAQEADPDAPPRAAVERLWQTWVDAALRRLLALCAPSVAARLPAAEVLGSEGSSVYPAVGAERGDAVEIGKKRFFVLRLRDAHSVPPGADGGRPPDSGEPYWLSSFAQFRFRAGYEKAAEALRSHTQGGDLLSCEAVRRLCAAGYLRRPPLAAGGGTSEEGEDGEAEAEAQASAATAARLDGLGAMHASAAFRHSAWAAARRSGAAHAAAVRRLHRKGVPAHGVTPVRLGWEVDTAAAPAPEVPLDAAADAGPEGARGAAGRRRTAEAAGAWLARVVAKDAEVAAVAETTRAAVAAVTGAASVRVFGSAAAGAADPSRFDVDLYLEAGEGAELALLGHVAVPPEDRLSRREAEGFCLLDAAAALRGAEAAAGVAAVEEVLAARVPVVRASVKGVPVDLTVRFLGCANTALFSEYMQVCPVVRPLFLVLKRWAAWSGVRQVATDAGHLTSYALQLLMLYALVRKGAAPAVVLTGENGTDYVQAARRRAAAAAPAAVFPAWEKKGAAATEEVLRLFGVFLRFYATEFDWDAHVVCVRSVGAEVPPVSKEEAGWAEACCCVRDPFESDLNLAKRESAKARASLTRRFALSLAALNSGEMEALFAEA